MSDQKPTILQRAFKLEPRLSLGQWCYDRIAGNWPSIVALFGTGSVSYLASLTEWVRPWGSFGYGVIAIVSALVIWIGLSLVQMMRAKAALRRAEASAINKWKEVVDTVNPLDGEFHKRRIKISDLAHPVSKRISNKKFTDCQLVGPANLIILDNVSFFGSVFFDSDFVLTKNQVSAYNVIGLESSSLSGCQVLNVTLFIHPSIINEVKNMPGIYFVNLTGDQEIDNRSPPSTATETRR